MKLKFKTKDILKILIKNKKEHLKIVKEAQSGYRKKMIKLLKEKLNDLSDGKEVSSRDFYLSTPVHHIDDYDRTIEMLNLCVDEEIELSEGDFQKYIRNQWQWRDNFLLSNSAYSRTATTYLNERCDDTGDIIEFE